MTTQAQIVEAIWNDLSPQLKVLIAKATNYALTAAAEVGQEYRTWDELDIQDATIERCVQVIKEILDRTYDATAKERLNAAIAAICTLKDKP